MDQTEYCTQCERYAKESHDRLVRLVASQKRIAALEKELEWKCKEHSVFRNDMGKLNTEIGEARDRALRQVSALEKAGDEMAKQDCCDCEDNCIARDNWRKLRGGGV